MAGHDEIRLDRGILEDILNGQVPKRQRVGGGIEVAGGTGIVGDGVDVAVGTARGASKERIELAGVDEHVEGGTAAHRDTSFEVGIAVGLPFRIEEVVDGREGILVVVIVSVHGGFGFLTADGESELHAATFQLGRPGEGLFPLAGGRR